MLQVGCKFVSVVIVMVYVIFLMWGYWETKYDVDRRHALMPFVIPMTICVFAVAYKLFYFGSKERANFDKSSPSMAFVVFGLLGSVFIVACFIYEPAVKLWPVAVPVFLWLMLVFRRNFKKESE